MFRSSFTVSFRKDEAKKRTVVLGVTSIVPNLNGLLLYTEDGEDYQIESHELRGHDEDDSPYLRLRVEYSDKWDIETYEECGFDFHDHRAK